MDRPQAPPVSWWVPGVAILGLIVVFVVALVAGERRREDAMGGRHHWIEPADVDDSGGDVELLAAVTGLGEQREHGREAWTAALDFSTVGWDLRGRRDVDPETSNPWGSA